MDGINSRSDATKDRIGRLQKSSKLKHVGKKKLASMICRTVSSSVTNVQWESRLEEKMGDKKHLPEIFTN